MIYDIRMSLKLLCQIEHILAKDKIWLRNNKS